MNVPSKKQENILLIIWAQSLLAVCGSLFYSEVMGYTPCELCWYQRIIMYPLIIIYGVGLVKKDVHMTLPGLILSGIGLIIASYHYGVQKITVFQDTDELCGEFRCTLQYGNYFGFITIHFLSFLLFFVYYDFIFVINIIFSYVYWTYFDVKKKINYNYCDIQTVWMK